MKIGSFDLSRRVLVVAEVGNNHEGNFAVAKKMVWEAARCGAGAVKFQTMRAEYYISREDKERFARIKSFELSGDQFGQLADLTKSLGLLFISTPFDLGSAALLEDMVDAYKIASGDNNFFPLIGQVARTGKPLIISLGLSGVGQAKRTIDYVKDEWSKGGIGRGQMAILHCVSAYPVKPEQANLRAVPYLVEKFPELAVGYSDHTLGITACLVAVTLGARIVEKHFTLDKNHSDFQDHKLSADPADMQELVRRIGEEEVMLGKFSKELQSDEQEAEEAIRRSIVAVRDLPVGHVVEFDDLNWIRPAGGLAPGEEDKLVGNSLKRTVTQGEQIMATDVNVRAEAEVVARIGKA